VPFQVLITADAQQDLDALRASDRKTILDAMEAHLTHEPMRVSRSRIKKLSQPAISQYRLRVGDYRVYYDVEEEAQHVVVIQIYEKAAIPLRARENHESHRTELPSAQL
jgi:mRNA interferase RelE/StbE